MGILSIFNPISSAFYKIVLSIKFSWFTRKRRKREKVAKSFLSEKLQKKGLEEDAVQKIVENYLKFGDLVFDIKIIHAAFSLNRTLNPKRLLKNKNNS
ncbi:MAG: hypothetical protein ACXABK_02615 [Candidatus Heimdallarchaeaceae archaeon]|jgi:hypothetical protein